MVLSGRIWSCHTGYGPFRQKMLLLDRKCPCLGIFYCVLFLFHDIIALFCTLCMVYNGPNLPRNVLITKQVHVEIGESQFC